MLEEVEPVPAVQLSVAWPLPAVADIPVAADGGGRTGVILYSVLQVIPALFLDPN